MRHHDERGSVTVWGVLIALVITMVIGITVDLTGQVNAQQRAHDLAQQAGRTAANQVQAGQPLMAIVSLDDVWILANYKETQLERVRPGQKVEIKVDTFSGKILEGRVDSIMAGTGSVFSLFPPENATGNYVKVVQRIPVKIVLDQGSDPDRVLRVGMSVQPTIAVR